MIDWWVHLSWSQAALCLCVVLGSVAAAALIIAGPKPPEVLPPPDGRTRRNGPEAAGKVHYLLERRR